MRRRDLIALVGGATAAWSLPANAQHRTKPVLGFLSSYSPGGHMNDLLASFYQGLREAGYDEGRNVAIEYRWAEGRYERLPELAADLVRRRVAVIVASGGSASAQVAKAATATIPIVFSLGGDPVKLSLVASLARPGGNITGAATLSSEMGPKQLELLHEVVPPAAVIAALLNPTNPGAENWWRDLQAAARAAPRVV